MTTEQRERPHDEADLNGKDFAEMVTLMQGLGRNLEGSDPGTEVIFQGSGDVGIIQTSADTDTSAKLLQLARIKFKGSFSEEEDPQDENGLIRLQEKFTNHGLWMIDPVDGTGDWTYGALGTPEKKGFSILSSHLKDGEVQASIAVRPAYNQTLTYKDGRIFDYTHGFNMQGDSESTILGVEVTNKTREQIRAQFSLVPDDVVCVNTRNAYTEVNFPPDFWKFAHENTGIKFQEVRCGGAGDSLSKLVLGELDLVVARKGDWKAWDTGPFDPMIKTLGGRLTNCDNAPLGSYQREDLWHRRGVVASIGEKGLLAHNALITAMQKYKQDRGINLVISPPRKAVAR